MYPVSQAFKTALKKAQHVEHVRGYIGSISFTDYNVLGMTYSNQCSDSKDVVFGSARIGQLQARFVNLIIPRGDWRGQTITLDYGLELADSSIEWIPVGVFTIAKADWTEQGISVTAYDCLSGLDVTFPVNFAEGTIYGFLELAAELSGVQNGLTEQECEALPNGTDTLGLYNMAGVSTVRDLVSGIASAVGGFATADRTGKLVVKTFSRSALSIVDTFEPRERAVGSTFSDYSTNYEGVNIQDAESGTVMYYAAEGATDGVSISLGLNPLLQYGVQAVKDIQRQRLAEVAHSIAYTPFNITLLNCPAYDLGDLIECEGGVAGEETLTCCVMSIEWTFKNTVTLQGFGADPNLTAGKSKTDKALQQVAQNQKSNAFTYYTYTNAQQITLTTRPQAIARIKFAVNELTTVELWQSVQMIQDLLGTTQAVKLEYYYDGEKISREPTETYSEDGPHLMVDPWYLKSVTSGQSHTWAVYASVDSGTATIDVGDVNVLLKGQKMVAEGDFPGEIECIDEYIALEMISRFIAATDLSEVVTLTTLTPTEIRILESYDPETPEPTIAGSTEAVNIVLTARQFVRITEQEDYNRVTEEGDYYRATEA